MAIVLGLVHGEPGNYGISFPDFPGCIAGGDTIDDAIARGHDALYTHVETMVGEGMPIPDLRGIDAVRADPDYAEEVESAVTVAAIEFDLPSKAVRVNVSIDETLLRRIDSAARASGESRSAFLAAAARERLRH
jgi:predicted RNase H-like HicB family nuclease